MYLTYAAVEQRFVQDPVRNHDRQVDAEKEVHDDVVLAIVANNWITHQVRIIDRRAFDDDVGMLSGQEPSHVSKKATSSGIVRVGVCFSELVVQAMISGPGVDVVLAG